MTSATTANNEVEAFAAFLRTRGLKLTTQREQVLRRALASRKHFSADELCDHLRGDGTSKATVYRTLALLVEAGLLHSRDFERGHMLYEPAHARAHHDHLICVSCNSIVEFQNEAIERLQEQVAAAHEFEMVSHTHQIFGVCRRCRRRDGGPRPPSGRRPRLRERSERGPGAAEG